MAECVARELGAAKRRRAVVFALAVSALAPLLVYWPTPGDSWVRIDNQILIRQEPKVLALTLEGDARAAALAEIFTTAHGDLYQPLLTFSLAVDHAIFGWDRSGFHAHSLLLHLFIVAAVFWLAYRLAGVTWAALLAALFVGLHPVMVETVTWVIHRTLLITAFWILLGTHAYLSYVRALHRWWWLVIATAAFGLSMMAKAVGTVVVVPFLIDCWLRRRPGPKSIAEKTPLAVLAVFFTWLNLDISQGRAGGVELEGLALQLLESAPAAFTLSVANVVVPQKLTFFYPSAHLWSILGWRWIPAWLALLSVLGLALWLWRRGARGLLLGLLGWLALLAPFLLASAFRDVATADRYLYIALVILAPGLAEAMVWLQPASRSARRIALAALTAIIVTLGVQARGQARQWFDEVVLWRAVLDNGEYPVAYGAMGNVFAERRQWPEAVSSYERALALLEREFSDQVAPLYYLNLTDYSLRALAPLSADAPEREKFLAAAMRGARLGIGRWPNHADLHHKHGLVLLEMGEEEEAQVAFETAIANDPRHFKALTEYGIVLDRQGQTGRALEVLIEALRNAPGYPRALQALGAILAAREDYGPAAELYFRWARVRPQGSDAHRHFLALVRAGLDGGRSQAVKPWLERYLELFPASSEAQELLAQLAREGGS